MTAIGTEYSLQTGKQTESSEVIYTGLTAKAAAVRHADSNNGTVGPSGRTVFYGDNLCLVFIQG